MARVMTPGWAACLVILFGARSAQAQEPKVGDYYTDSSDLGFKIRVPQRSEVIPASPGDANLIVKYDPATNKVIQLGKSSRLDMHTWLVKFDRRQAGTDDTSLLRKLSHVDLNITDWVHNTLRPGLMVEGKPKDFQVDKIAATEYVFSEKVEEGVEVKLYAAVFKLRPDVDVALVLWGPGDPKKWSKFEAPARQMAHSFRTVEVKAAKSTAPVGDLPRDKVRAKLQADVLKTPGWKLYETDHYFIVSNNDDKDFLDELKGRLEAIHTFYEQDYPAAKAKELRLLGMKVKTGTDPEPKEAEEKKPEPEVPDLRRLLDDGIDPQEKARCSVVRVCKDAELYHSYGGPPSSAGYWNWVEQELVLYDARKTGGKADTWAVLNHEAFHQYIFYFYGNISPHSWYNEGTGDFYSGYEYKNKKFTLKKFLWRNDTIKQSIQQKSFVPLKDFVRFTQPEYYGHNKFGTDGYQNYAEGWSFIYFLRTGKKGGARNWDPKWDTILDTYLRVLATSGKIEQAVEEAFQGIDFDELQTSWADYTTR
jgi:hypothetical protein